LNSAESFDGAEEVRRAWMAGLAPDPSLTVSQWADRHRILSSRAASEAGPYRTDRTPYMRGIMDALSPAHPASRVVFMKSAQVGATEAATASTTLQGRSWRFSQRRTSRNACRSSASSR